MILRGLLPVLAVLATACQPRSTAPDGTGDASGVVREFLAAPIAPNTLTRILVEHPARANSADRSIVHVGINTELLVRTRTGEIRRGEVSDIRVGIAASIGIKDVELRSNPRQVFATRIVVPE